MNQRRGEVIGAPQGVQRLRDILKEIVIQEHWR